MGGVEKNMAIPYNGDEDFAGAIFKTQKTRQSK